MSDTSVEQKPVQEMKKAPAKGTVTAVISLAGQREDFVSQGVDFGTTEQNAWLYAYKGQADDADVYIDFDLQLQAGVRDVVIGGRRTGRLFTSAAQPMAAMRNPGVSGNSK